MTSPEIHDANQSALENIVREKLKHPTNEEGRKEARRVRTQNRTAFLAIADDLLEEFGRDESIEKNDIRTTEPVAVVSGEHAISVQVQRISSASDDDKFRDVFTAMIATLPGQDAAPLFVVEQNYNGWARRRNSENPTSTSVRNQFQRTASNEEVERARRAITYISQRLRISVPVSVFPISPNTP